MKVFLLVAVVGAALILFLSPGLGLTDTTIVACDCAKGTGVRCDMLCTETHLGAMSYLGIWGAVLVLARVAMHVRSGQLR